MGTGDEYKHKWIAVLTFLAGAILALVLLVSSTGTATDDEIGHFLIARDAWTVPALILNEWGRAGNTLAYMLPSLLGLPAARLWSLGLSALAVLIASRVARQLNAPYYWLTPLLLWFQPWFGNLSFSAITEVPFSLLAIAATSLFLGRRFTIAGLLIGLLPLVRHEGILLVGLWLIWSLYHRRCSALLLALAPLAIYNVVAFATQGSWPLTMYLAVRPTDYYGSGSWLHYVPRLVSGTGVPVTLIALLAVPALVRDGTRRLVLVWYAAYLALQVVLFRYGLFATGGYRLMLFPLAPGIAVAALFGLPGLESLARRLRRALSDRTAAVVIPLAGLVIFVVGLSVPPFQSAPEQRASAQAAAWVRQAGLTHNRIVATNVWFYYYLPLPVDRQTLWSGVPDLTELPSGTLAVWDTHYADHWGLRHATLESADSGWHLRESFVDGAVLVFQKE